MPFDEDKNSQVSATYRGDQITAVFNGHIKKDSYGVPGSPVWDVVEDIEIQSLEILGHEVDPAVLPQALQTEIIDLSDDLIWEN